MIERGAYYIEKRLKTTAQDQDGGKKRVTVSENKGQRRKRERVRRKRRNLGNYSESRKMKKLICK